MNTRIRAANDPALRAFQSRNSALESGMKPNFFAVTLAAFLAIACLSSRSEGADVSCVWQVKSGTNTIYLAGSIPFLREEDQPLPTPFRRAYESAERVVFEVHPRDSKDEAQSQKLIRMGMFTDGGSIRKAISKQTYEELGDFLESTGAPRASVDQFKPWFAAIMISMTELIKQGVRPDLGVADLVEGWALEDDRPISGLEPMMAEIRLLRGLPKAAHEQMLKSTLEEVADTDLMNERFGKFVAAWRSGDVETLEELDAEDDTKWDRLIHQKLILDRGKKWMRGLEKTLGGDVATLYVVGLSHLIGDGNLLEKLDAKGYEIALVEAAGQPQKSNQDRKNKKKKKPALIPVIWHTAATARSQEGI